MCSLGERLKSVSDRAVVLRILEELATRSKLDASDIEALCISIPLFWKFLTGGEMKSRLDPLIALCSPIDALVTMESQLAAMRCHQEVQTLIGWICGVIDERMLIGSLDVGDELEQQKYDELVGSLVGLPVRISNCLGMARTREESEQVRKCVNLVEETTVSSIKFTMYEAHLRIGNSSSINMQTVARLIAKGKNLRAGDSKTLLEEIFMWICKQDQSDRKWDRMAQRIFTDQRYGVREFEALATSLILLATKWEDIQRAFGSLSNCSPIVKRVLGVKLLFQRVLHFSTLCVIVDYFVNCGDTENLANVLDNSIRIWSNISFAKVSRFEAQKQIARLILYIIYSIRNKSEWDWGSRFLEVSQGIQNRLSNPDIQIRQTAMFIGECFSKMIEDAEKQLNFDYEEDEWMKEMRSIRENGMIIECEVDVEKDTNCIPEVDMSKCRVVEDLDSDDEDFPVYQVAEEEKTFETLAEGQEPLKKADSPKYIADAFEQLLEKEKYEVFEAALHSIEPLIRRNAIGFASLAPNIATRLVFLENRFSTPSFEEIRGSCLSGCLAARPEVVAHVVQLLLSADCTMSHRLVILEAIRNAAMELGKPVEIVSAETPSTSNCNEVEWKRIVEERIAKKTRRFGEKNRQTRFVDNRLGQVVNLFFYPLLIQQTGRNLELRGRDSSLLSKIVFTLTEIFHHAGLSPKCPQMAISLIDYVAPFRYSDDSNLRISVIFAYCSVVDVLNYELLENVFGSSKITDWAEWASQVSSSLDSNEHEKKLAACLLGEIWRKIEK